MFSIVKKREPHDRLKFRSTFGKVSRSTTLAPTLSPYNITVLQYSKEYDAFSSVFQEDVTLRVQYLLFDGKINLVRISSLDGVLILKKLSGTDKFVSSLKEDDIGVVISPILLYLLALQKQREYGLAFLKVESCYKSIKATAESSGIIIATVI